MLIEFASATSKEMENFSDIKLSEESYARMERNIQKCLRRETRLLN